MAQKTWAYSYMYSTRYFWVSEVVWLDCVGVLFLIFWRTSVLSGVIYILTGSRVPSSHPFLPQYLFLVIFLMIAILTGVVESQGHSDLQFPDS
jgi:hypothetical protein